MIISAFALAVFASVTTAPTQQTIIPTADQLRVIFAHCSRERAALVASRGEQAAVYQDNFLRKWRAELNATAILRAEERLDVRRREMQAGSVDRNMVGYSVCLESRWLQLVRQALPQGQGGDAARPSSGASRPADSASSGYLSSLRERAERGSAEAQNSLGVRYANGDGVARNDVEASNWYRRSADQGNAAAQTNLGVMYFNGRGVPQNDEEAARLFRLAADQNLAGGQNNLGYLYSVGRGVPQSDTEALRWFRLAAAQGDPQAIRSLRRIEERMAAGQTGGQPEGQRIYDTPEEYAQSRGGAAPAKPGAPAPQTGENASDESRCITVDASPKGAAHFVNGCRYAVNITACVVYAESYTGSRNFDCLARHGRGSWSFPALGRQAALIRGGQVHWAACRGPAYPVNVRFETGRGLLHECR